MSEQATGALFSLPADTKDYFSADDESTTKTKMILAIASIKSEHICTPLLKTLPGNAFNNQSDKLVAEKLPLVTSGLVF